MPVSNAVSRLSLEISHPTYHTAYTPFTPSESEQRLPHTYYRGCWHVISRGLFLRYRHRSTISCQLYSSLRKGVYNPKAFILHAASLRQACAHCGIFLAAASRRSLGRISVPMWPYTLSGRLSIVALVGHYPTNKLIVRGPISRRRPKAPLTERSYDQSVLCGITTSFLMLSPIRRQITHVLLTRLPLSLEASFELSFDLHA
jgi:hypothetical protein